MDNREFVKLSRRSASQIVVYLNDEAPRMVVSKTLRFIDGNFRAQGWQGATFKPWKHIKRKGTILVNKGALRRSPNGMTGRGWAKIYTNVPYADVHNRGGIINTTAHIRAYTRRRFSNAKINRAGGDIQVKAHTRKMKIEMPQRQFMPYEGHGSPVLDNNIKQEIDRKVRPLLTI